MNVWQRPPTQAWHRQNTFALQESGTVTSVVVDSAGEALVCSGSDCILLVSLASSKLKQRYKAQSPVVQGAMTADLVFGLASQKLYQFDRQSGSLQAMLSLALPLPLGLQITGD